MLVNVYQLTGACARSVATASLVAAIEVDRFPRDQIAFAREYGGDFIEVQTEEDDEDEA